MKGIFYKSKLVYTISQNFCFKNVLYTLNSFPRDTLKRKLFVITCFFYSLFRKLGFFSSNHEIIRTLSTNPFFLNKSVSFIIWSNSESERVRYYVNVIDDEGKCVCFGKISYENNKERLEAEYKNLKLLSKDSTKPFEVPKPIYFESNEEYTLLLVEPIGKHFKKAKFEDLPAKNRVISYFEKISKVKEVSLEKYFSNTMDSNYHIEKYPELKSVDKVKLGFCHMDIGSENVFLDNSDTLLIIDWEFSNCDSPVMCDRVSSWLGRNSIGIRKKEVLLEDFRKAFYDGINDAQYLIALIYYASNDFFLAMLLLNSNKSRILRVSSSYYPALSMGGPVTADYAFDLLSSRFNQVEVITTNAGLETIGRHSFTKKFGAIDVTYFPYLLSRNISLSFSLLFSLVRKIKSVDVVHISGVWNFPVLVAPLICCLFRVKYIITPHGSIYHEKIERKHSFLKRFIIRIIVSNSFRKAYKIQVTTDDEKNGIIKVIGDTKNLTIVPFPLLNTTVYERDSINIKGLLFVGRLSYIKGLDLLIPAFLNLLQSHEKLELLIAGNDEDNLSRRITDEIPDEYRCKVRWLGSQSQEQLDLLYRDDYMFVLPSYSENYGMVVLEAAARSMPIVISDKVGLSNVFQEMNAAVICKTNVSSLTDCMLMVLESGELSREISKNAANLFKSEFSIESISDRITKLYGEK